MSCTKPHYIGVFLQNMFRVHRSHLSFDLSHTSLLMQILTAHTLGTVTCHVKVTAGKESVVGNLILLHEDERLACI